MLTPDDRRALADCLAVMCKLIEKMGEEPPSDCFRPGQAYTSRSGAAVYLGCSRENIRKLILAGKLTEGPAGIKITELKEYAAGKPAGNPAKDYRIESPRAAARRGLKC